MAAAFEAGLTKLRAQTPAKPGDKTMVDALVPAIDALRQAADAGAEPAALLAQAAEAAQNGAEGTSELQARFGRAGISACGRSATSIPGRRRSRCCSRGFRDGVGNRFFRVVMPPAGMIR